MTGLYSWSVSAPQILTGILLPLPAPLRSYLESSFMTELLRNVTTNLSGSLVIALILIFLRWLFSFLMVLNQTRSPTTFLNRLRSHTYAVINQGAARISLDFPPISFCGVSASSSPLADIDSSEHPLERKGHPVSKIQQLGFAGHKLVSSLHSLPHFPP